MSVMAVAGMYDGAGDWLTRGHSRQVRVAGGLVGVLPGSAWPQGILAEAGFAWHSAPRRAFERLSTDMGMHLFAPSPGRLDVIDGGAARHARNLLPAGQRAIHRAAELLDIMSESRFDGDVHVDISRVFLHRRGPQNDLGRAAPDAQ